MRGITDAELVEQLVASLPRLDRAVRVREVRLSGAGMVSGGAPSYELVSLAAFSLLQDLRSQSAYHEQQLRSLDGVSMRTYRPARDLVSSLRHFVQALDACSAARLDALSVTEARRQLSVWVARSALVLRDVSAPYRLLGPDGRGVVCPIVEQGDGGAYACLGPLLVHRDNETGVPRTIRCRDDSTHEWQNGPGWLRLGALLGVC